MRKLYYIFVALLVIILGVEFRISEKEILKRLQRISRYFFEPVNGSVPGWDWHRVLIKLKRERS